MLNITENARILKLINNSNHQVCLCIVILAYWQKEMKSRESHSPLPNIKKHPSVKKNNESIIVIKYPNLKSNIISLKEFFETFNFSIVQILFHVERSTAVGIHPINAIINKMLFLSLITGLIKLSETSVGPFITQTINADKVLKSKIDDINLIMSSKMTYLPKKE